MWISRMRQIQRFSSKRYADLDWISRAAIVRKGIYAQRAQCKNNMVKTRPLNKHVVYTQQDQQLGEWKLSEARQTLGDLLDRWPNAFVVAWVENNVLWMFSQLANNEVSVSLWPSPGPISNDSGGSLLSIHWPSMSCTNLEVPLEQRLGIKNHSMSRKAHLAHSPTMSLFSRPVERPKIRNLKKKLSKQ